MRVLFLTPWYPEADHIYRGVFVREHAKAVRAAGNEVVVLHLAGKSYRGRGLWRMAAESDPALSEGIPRTASSAGRCPSRDGRTHLNMERGPSLASPACLRLSAGPDPRQLLLRRHLGLCGRQGLAVPVVVTEHSTAFPCASWAGNGRCGQIRDASRGRCDAGLRLPAEGDGGLRRSARFRVVPNAVDTTAFHRRREPHHGRVRGG